MYDEISYVECGIAILDFSNKPFPISTPKCCRNQKVRSVGSHIECENCGEFLEDIPE